MALLIVLGRGKKMVNDENVIYSRFDFVGKFFPIGKVVVIWGLTKYRINSLR